MNTKDVYRFIPTGKGVRLVSDTLTDENRDKICALYPDADRKNVYREEDMPLLDRSPFRPVVCAWTVPRYTIDMHSALGMAGYGRFAIVKNGQAFWLDEFNHVETEYDGGEVRYVLRDEQVTAGRIGVTFVASKGLTGLMIRIDCTEADQDLKICYLHGGLLSWNTHSPLNLPYTPDLCFENAVSVCGDWAEICPEDTAGSFTYPGLTKIDSSKTRMSGNCGWVKVPGFKRKLIVSAPGRKMFIAPPDSLLNFTEDKLCTAESANGGVACALMEGGDVYYALVGCGEKVKCTDPEKLFASLRAENDKIADRLQVHSGDPVFDGAVRAGAFHTNGMFADNVYVHGNLSWRDGYVGWRNAYGPLAYGMYDQTYTHLDTHFTKTLFAEGPDVGAFNSTLEGSNKKRSGWVFYGMHQTFIDQAKRYWEYTGDKAYAERLLPIVEGCIDRENRRIKPGEEMLYENSLNTWISDSHWTRFGQCTQASAYLYNMHMLAADLAEDAEKKSFYSEKAAQIKADMHRVLWQKRKGVFGYAQDLLVNKLFHGEPELADIYHSTEFGICDPIEVYQMLDWVEGNLRASVTPNGGRVYWNSNWFPNSGRTYTHSTYELNPGEELNLSLAYQQIGLSEQGYEIFKSIYMAMYGGEPGDTYDCDVELFMAQGRLPLHCDDGVLDLPCHITNTGAPRRNPYFADTIGMFGRALYEGVLGIRPMLHKGEVWLTPGLPAELPTVDVRSAALDYSYTGTAGKTRIGYHMKHPSCTLCVKLHLPVSSVQEVTVNGKPSEYTIAPAFHSIDLQLSVPDACDGEICVTYTAADILPMEARREIRPGEKLVLQYPCETVTEVLDPQGLLTDISVEGDSFTAEVTGEAGSGVFFLRMLANGTEYIRPVKIRIPTEEKQNIFRSFREEFSAPYLWKTVDIDSVCNASSPAEVVKMAHENAIGLPGEYNYVNTVYYWMHPVDRLDDHPLHEFSDRRWKSMIDENGIVMTGEEIPFRAKKDGNYLAAVTTLSKIFSDRVTTEIGDSGRAAYVLITGTTFPMQSHVENLRITFTYEDGVTEEHPLVNPYDIGDMWLQFWRRYHDTPASGFENLSGKTGAMSSAGLDLTKPIPTDTEAHILRFRLREGVKVTRMEMRAVANDVIFALMGITLLK
ncbi:MAG: DUF4450 domain-containing protein [Ruminococcaceae bacterium]|nr:DUF4450 domain-containing protein [Oscillospiraceae bacterium]